MTGQTGILIALIALTGGLAAAFLIRPSITKGPTGKILAFVGLFILPALCLAGGMSAQVQRSEETQFCISCHSMEPFGRSLYVDDPKYIPAVHFQDHRVPAGQACYACHADYTIFGPFRDKLRGAERFYKQYITSPPNPITIPGGYNNAQCLHCHSGARNFVENPIHSAIMDTLASNQLSCVSSGCHDSIHNIGELSRLKFWRPGQ